MDRIICLNSILQGLFRPASVEHFRACLRCNLCITMAEFQKLRGSVLVHFVLLFLLLMLLFTKEATDRIFFFNVILLVSCFGARATFSGMNAHGVKMTFPYAFSWACDIFKCESGILLLQLTDAQARGRANEVKGLWLKRTCTISMRDGRLILIPQRRQGACLNLPLQHGLDL